MSENEVGREDGELGDGLKRVGCAKHNHMYNLKIICDWLLSLTSKAKLSFFRAGHAIFLGFQGH